MCKIKDGSPFWSLRLPWVQLFRVYISSSLPVSALPFSVWVFLLALGLIHTVEVSFYFIGLQKLTQHKLPTSQSASSVPFYPVCSRSDVEIEAGI